MIVHGEPRARTQEIKKLVKPALREREREYKIIWNYQIISYLFFNFFTLAHQWIKYSNSVANTFIAWGATLIKINIYCLYHRYLSLIRTQK